MPTLLRDLAETSQRVADARGRNEKRDRLAATLAALDPDVRAAGIALSMGELPQGKIGVGWAALRDLDVGPAPSEATLTLRETSGVLDAIARAKGGEKKRLLGGLVARATQPERAMLSAILGGGLRQGALDGVVLEALAAATKLAPAAVRRAAMLGGSIPTVGADLLAHGASALDRYDLVPFRPILPMLASPIGDLEEALSSLGEAALETKIDGARLQVHKDGDEVRLYTRALHDVSARAPEIVREVRALPARSLVLDGEAIAFDASGRPLPFQTTMSRFGRRAAGASEPPLSVRFFDAVHVDGSSLLDAPLRERRAALALVVPEPLRIDSIVTRELDRAELFYASAIERGHEGVMAKSLEAPYEAGARGASWLKIKPAHTLDLVVLAVERGSGRRQGWLSNLHLGARDPASGGFVMLGKTFKGMTDAMLAWQTSRLAAIATSEEDGFVVHVRPELVVEIAFNDVQESPHYPGGLALRFARVKRYREDKPASEADTIDAVRAIFARSRRQA